mmetsp:Transcript_10312/g.24579  ORF Transcript_10312/g.24579 Transcript_10312/m.24579 type:complete len:171 (-) Transcript_10312:976-1488(-)
MHAAPLSPQGHRWICKESMSAKKRNVSPLGRSREALFRTTFPANKLQAQGVSKELSQARDLSRRQRRRYGVKPYLFIDKTSQYPEHLQLQLSYQAGIAMTNAKLKRITPNKDPHSVPHSDKFPVFNPSDKNNTMNPQDVTRRTRNPTTCITAFSFKSMSAIGRKVKSVTT